VYGGEDAVGRLSYEISYYSSELEREIVMVSFIAGSKGFLRGWNTEVDSRHEKKGDNASWRHG